MRSGLVDTDLTDPVYLLCINDVEGNYIYIQIIPF